MKCPSCGAVWFEDFGCEWDISKCPFCSYPYQNDCCGAYEMDRMKSLREWIKKSIDKNGKKEE